MSVKIRLKRIGRKKQPTYRIVIIDSRNPSVGKVIESLGYYAPYLKDKKIELNLERYSEWQSKGAIPSETVKRLHKVVRQQGAGAEPKPVAKKTKADFAVNPVETPVLDVVAIPEIVEPVEIQETVIAEPVVIDTPVIPVEAAGGTDTE